MPSARAKILAATLAACSLLSAAASAARAQEPLRPPAGAWFQYELVRTVGNGSDAYASYWDRLTSRGRYELVSADGPEPRFSARYAWTFASAEKNESGTIDREATFRLADRLYTSALTDLDDMDRLPAAGLAVWLWIPPDVPVGTPLRILEHYFNVRARDVVFADGVVAIEVAGTGTGTRDDAYGTYDVTWEDVYSFDQTTGMFLGSACRERDVGTFEGESAAFTVTETVRVMSASYAPLHPASLIDEENTRQGDLYLPPSGGGDSTSRGAVICVFALGIPFMLGIVCWLAYGAYRRKYPSALTIDGQRIDLAWLDAPRGLPSITPEASVYFGPFLEHFVNAAFHARDPVLVARRGGSLFGLAIHHREGKIATILAQSTQLCETMRALLRVDDFFTEVRHLPPGNLGAQASAAGLKVPVPKDAYNLYETYHVLRVSPIPELAYDANVVTRLTTADLPDLAALATAVWGVASAGWLQAQLAAGDIGFCVRDAGKLVAFGLATQVGSAGRVHTLAVAADHRGRGLGKEIMRARLRALADLGVESVICEIATWNLASLDVAHKHGFARVGDMFVESARSVRVERKFVRR